MQLNCKATLREELTHATHITPAIIHEHKKNKKSSEKKIDSFLLFVSCDEVLSYLILSSRDLFFY